MSEKLVYQKELRELIEEFKANVIAVRPQISQRELDELVRLALQDSSAQ